MKLVFGIFGTFLALTILYVLVLFFIFNPTFANLSIIKFIPLIDGASFWSTVVTLYLGIIYIMSVKNNNKPLYGRD
jgi:hypothetical protein